MLKRLLLAIIFVPQICFASVRISEIAWMGTTDSSSNEWIELMNDGAEEVDLSGYKIVSTDDGLSVSLKGTISPHSYYLIERTDDTSVPSVTADLIATFGSGLSNAGETLRILNSDGQVIDEVVGGGDWKNIGGSSGSKDTPQLFGGKWVTASPTPRREAAGEEETVLESTPDTTTQTTTTSSSGSSSGSSSSKVEAPKKLKETFRIVVKHEGNILKDSPEIFKATVYGLSDELLPNAKVKWNFGDGTTSEGKEVNHTYRFEGVYPIVITASHNDIVATSRTRIEVLAQNIKIVGAESGLEGFVKISGASDIDISGWSIRSGGYMFKFPEGTELYAKTPVSFANSITGITDHSALALHQPNGKIVSAFGPDSENKIKTISTVAYRSSVTKDTPEESFPKMQDEVKQVATDTASLASVINGSNRPTWIYWVLALAFACIAGIIIYISRVFNPNREIEDEASKYTLVEIDSNLE